VWESTVRTEQSAAVSAPPDLAWSLLRSPQAWSLRPVGCMTFDIALAGPGPLRFCLMAGYGPVVAAVLEITAEVAGQLIRLQAPGGRAAWELSVETGRRGPVLRVAASLTVDRRGKVGSEATLRDETRQWLAALRATAEGRSPWPADGMPDALRAACLATPPLVNAAVATAAIDVDARPDQVGRLLAAPEVMRAIQPENVAECGYAPGVPAGQVGAIRYYVYRSPADGRLFAMASLIAGVTPGAMMVRAVTAPYSDTDYRYEAAGSGTRLELTHRVPGQARGDPQAHAAAVTDLAHRYQAVLERLR
jgi:hypothetical protein